jgi:hypothetical protein
VVVLLVVARQDNELDEPVKARWCSPCTETSDKGPPVEPGRSRLVSHRGGLESPMGRCPRTALDDYERGSSRPPRIGSSRTRVEPPKNFVSDDSDDLSWLEFKSVTDSSVGVPPTTSTAGRSAGCSLSGMPPVCMTSHYDEAELVDPLARVERRTFIGMRAERAQLDGNGAPSRRSAPAPETLTSPKFERHAQLCPILAEVAGDATSADVC